MWDFVLRVSEHPNECEDLIVPDQKVIQPDNPRGTGQQNEYRQQPDRMRAEPF